MTAAAALADSFLRARVVVVTRASARSVADVLRGYPLRAGLTGAIRGALQRAGVRPDKTEVSVDGMSDGTRDQLFLALRLATIERQRDQQDPLPFVVDDILVGFDDERSKACLEVLAEFAQKTQVLVFTHHSMVAQAAHVLGKEKGVFVHELAG